MKKYLLFSLFLCILVSSCSRYKDVAYFQDIEKSLEGKFDSPEFKNTLKIKIDDELSIIVSAEDPQVAAPFNLPMVVSSPLSSAFSGDNKIGQQQHQTQTIQTYLVNSEGDIHLPVLGKIKVVGMTRDELVIEVEERVKKYIKDPIVNVRLVNFRISVLGEVTLPGVYTYNTQDVSILDAMASANDMLIHGQRNNVLVIRRTDQRNEYYRVDLTSSDILSSPNFYLQQNDIVYVLPNKEKQRDANSGQQKQFNMSVITTAISTVISVIAILIR